MTPVARGHDRLRHGADIARVLRGRQQRAGRLVVAHVRTRPDDGGGSDAVRVATVASRRVGDAVRRNRAKRVLREAVRHLPVAPGTDLVLVARAETPLATMQAVQAELAGVLETLGVLDQPAAEELVP